jgi:cytochrome P450
MKHPLSDLGPFQRDPLQFFLDKGVGASTSLVRLNMGFSPVYLIADAELIKPVFKAPEADIDKGRLIYKLREVIGESSMVLSGPRHRERRAAIHARLARGVADGYAPDICAIIRSHAGGVALASEFDAHKFSATLAVRIIANILFGQGVLTANDENNLVAALHMAEDDLAAKIFKIAPDWPWVYFRKKRRLAGAKRMMQFVVERTQKRATEHSILSALQALNLTPKQMQEEILLLLLSGHHTSGSAGGWLLYHLAIYPDLASQIALEAMSVATPDGEIDATKLKDAKISLAVAKETLRLYPSAYWLSRETKRAMEIGGVPLRRGTSLIVSPWHIHRDPRYWPNPDQFDHTRDFSGPAFLPFGAGPRVCVGMGLGLLELQLLALEMASAFSIDLLSPRPAGRPRPSITIVPPSIRLRLTTRERVRQVPQAA